MRFVVADITSTILAHDWEKASEKSVDQHKWARFVKNNYLTFLNFFRKWDRSHKKSALPRSGAVVLAENEMHTSHTETSS